MPFLSVASKRSTQPISLYYETFGPLYSQNKLLFINGMGSILRQWDHQISFFSSRDFHVCCFDNRGAGKSDAPDIYYS